MLEWAKDPVKPLILSSPGGCTAAMRGIIDILQATPRSTVVATGYVASAAAGIFLAAERRLCTMNAVFLFHEPYAIYTRESNEYSASLEVCAESLKTDQDLFLDLLCEAGKGDVEYYRPFVAGEGRLLSADDMMAEGLVNQILTPKEYAGLIRAKKKPARRKPK